MLCKWGSYRIQGIFDANLLRALIHNVHTKSCNSYLFLMCLYDKAKTGAANRGPRSMIKFKMKYSRYRRVKLKYFHTDSLRLLQRSLISR